MALCAKPYMAALPYGCGQCLACRISKRREKTHRIMLEAREHTQNTFITLTYRDAELDYQGSVGPLPKHLPTLVLRDHQLFMKRFRRATNIVALRYFVVGEYGEDRERPHFHYAMFGYPQCSGSVNKEVREIKGLSCDCPTCSVVDEAWGKGKITCDTLNLTTAAYIAGYVVKKMTNPNNGKVLDYLRGRYPEFSKSSTGSGTGKGGIGAPYMDKLAEVCTSEFGSKDIVEKGDVPTQLFIEGRLLPLGRYLRRKLREKVGFEDVRATEAGQREAKEKLRDMHKDALTDPKFKNKSLKQIILAKDRGKLEKVSWNYHNRKKKEKF